MRTRAAALATDPLVEEIAQAELARSKSAVAAVVAGYFAAAGDQADVLLGPTVLLVAGVGSGGRVFDGRLRQPGLEAKRPRGFLPGEKVPDAAGVALPATIAALSVALVYDRASTLTPLARRGAAAAREAGSAERARLLDRIADAGPRALTDALFTRPLLHLASPSQGGLLSLADFNPPEDVALPALERPEPPGTALEAPFAADKLTGRAPSLSEALCAVDGRGVFAVLGYARLEDGLPVDALELVAAFGATPVERGKPRVRPGAPIACGAPFSIHCDETGAPREVRIGTKLGKRRQRALKIARSTGRWLEISR